jgi:hypothetical protein
VPGKDLPEDGGIFKPADSFTGLYFKVNGFNIIAKEGNPVSDIQVRKADINSVAFTRKVLL